MLKHRSTYALAASALVAVILGSSLTACSPKPADKMATSAPSAPSVPSNVQGPAPETLDSTKPVQTVSITSGALKAAINVHNMSGKYFYEVEGTLSDAAFAALNAKLAGKSAQEKTDAINSEIDKIFDQFEKQGMIGLKRAPEMAFFTAMIPYSGDLMAPLKKLRLNHGVIFNPLTYDPSVVKNVQAFQMEVPPVKSGARSNNTGYSGLDVMHVPGFVAAAQKDIGDGTAVDGSSVNLGITDTGITLNHPTFRSAKDKNKNRIKYLKDFTGEAAVFFDLDQKVTVTADPTDENSVILTATVIATPKLPDTARAGKGVEIKDLKITVSPELKKILLSDNAGGAKFGVMNEDVLNSDADPVDLNRNGKSDDLLAVFLIPGATPNDDGIYFDADGAGDFSAVKPIHNWNSSGETMTIFAEKAGVSVTKTTLPTADGAGKKTVRQVSIVGYDPGNHGSHVAGIAAGSKTISNDSNLTLARGAAPEANILLNRVCSNNNGCNATMAMIDMAVNGKAEVINMSLGGLSPFNDGYGVQETIINRLTVSSNVLFVVSAGNSGPGKQTLGSPSTARLTLSVGASATRSMIERQYQWPGLGATTSAQDPNADFLLFFSSRGPTASGDFKPNLTAPGTELSSVHLNSVAAGEAGLAVYWGTSMAAPSATGAYALFRDAIKKFNAAHPEKALPTDVLTLRKVLIASARPYDVNSYDPKNETRTEGQYTWIDEGTGMIDLEKAWSLLAQVRESNPAPAVSRADATPVELDYDIITAMKKNPSGNSYDGSRVGMPDVAALGFSSIPAFGKGLYLDARDTDQLRTVHIQRNLPSNLNAADDSAELIRQLETSGDQFALRTVFYGSDKAWLKVGVKAQLDCMNSDTEDLNVLGLGAQINKNADGTGSIVEARESTLNVCLDRKMVLSQLKPGDHGALIYAYRKVGDQVSPLPSFIVPVYLSVPNQTMTRSNGYELNDSVTSFGVKRNYVYVPEGTSVLEVTLEVPKAKVDENGLLADGEHCSGVELMAYQGLNTAPAFKTRPEARVTNCDASSGAPLTGDSTLKITFTKANPTPGMWDIHVFGRYQYALSNYKLKVDYISGSASKASISGDLTAATGKITWTLKDASVKTAPSSEKSTYSLNGLSYTSKADIAQDMIVAVENPLGKARAYPEGTKSVTISTGGSAGNDIDLTIMECDKADETDASCSAIGTSGGSTDVESVTFTPKAGKFYVANVAGYDIKGGIGSFTSKETITTGDELDGTISVSGTGPDYEVAYSISEAAINAPTSMAQNVLFKEKGYTMSGSLGILNDDGVTLSQVPVELKK